MPNNVQLRLVYTLLYFGTILLNPVPSYAHGGEKHNEKPKNEEVKAVESVTVAQDSIAHIQPAVTPEEHAQHEEIPASVHADLDDFPNRHPLFVHFPIVLLLVAAGVQLANVFFLRRSLEWVTTVTLLVSFATSYYVTYLDHPHTSGLSAHAKLVLEQHDLYADWTIYLAGTALLAQLLNQFLFKGKRWSVAVVAFLLVGAAYVVSMAGHYGAQLVYLEGVGPQGKYLESGHSH